MAIEFKNYSLRDYNTFNLDVSANSFIDIAEESLLEKTIQETDLNRPIIILGTGSNLLLTKEFDGLAIHLSTKGIVVERETENEILIACEAGELWHDVVTYCVEHQFFGIENMALIPGTIGASPIQNIGAYGTELKDVLFNVEGYDLHDKKKLIFSNTECQFGYRSSIFKSIFKNRFLITKVRLLLSKEKKLNLNYRALQEKFGHMSSKEVSIEDVYNFIIKIRSEKLPDPKLFGNAGSFFKNPEISSEDFQELKRKFPKVVSFVAANNTYKISAGWMIEECGWKGKRVGNVSCYEKQALVIVNHGGATGKEILEFSQKVQVDVKNKFGINLIPEVNII